VKVAPCLVLKPEPSRAAALAGLTTALNRDLPPAIRSVPASAPFRFEVHARYNPEQLTVLNIVPGLICVVLIFSTLFVMTLSITRETERGTMENLLAMPVRPIEVMLAKVIPYIVIGYVQVFLIIAMTVTVFGLPIRGSIPLLTLALGLLIASNLVLGVTLSTVARNQMQAVQMALFTLPSVFPSVRLHVPVQGHAGLGAMAWRGLSHHPCAADRARRSAKGQRPARDRSRVVANDCLHVGGRRDCDLVLSGNTRLTERTSKGHLQH
jgi:hypothetical protein